VRSKDAKIVMFIVGRVGSQQDARTRPRRLSDQGPTSYIQEYELPVPLPERLVFIEPATELQTAELDHSAIRVKFWQIPADVPSKPSRLSRPSPPPNVLVCVIDDDESIRRSLSRLFRSARLSAETFASAQAYRDRATHDGPSCLVLDVQLPGLDGLELQQALADRKEQIVFITGHGDVPMCTHAMKAGAVDFLTKPVDETVLLAAVSRALERSAEIHKTKAERASARAKLDRLTPREFEVLQRVIAGSLNKQIAAELGAAEKTVKVHRGRVMEKMGVTSVAELVRLTQVAGVAPSVARV
jgi:two-component system response regulator FixJ